MGYRRRIRSCKRDGYGGIRTHDRTQSTPGLDEECVQRDVGTTMCTFPGPEINDCPVL